MSSTYNLEPNPTAKVLLHTTSGDLEIELFAKQTPLTSRNFLQLCLDGYYDNTIFHRLVKGFIIQGGDPTGTGHGGESSFDSGSFADEFHSRLKFNRRGLLGMANTGKKDDNGSQFFFTLGNTPELQSQNTMFGRIQGDTIYNLVKMAEAEIADGSDERPMYPTKITSTEIIINPFDDMIKRARVAERTAPETKQAKKPKRKAGKAMLSFGDVEDESDPAPVAKKAKFNTKLVSAADENTASSSKAAPSSAPRVEKSIPIRKQTRKSPSRSPPPERISKKAPRSPPPEDALVHPPREPSPDAAPQTKLERVNAQIAEIKASMRRNNVAQSREPTKKKSLLEEMIPSTSRRGGRKRGAGASSAASEKVTLDLLSKFKSKLEATPESAKIRSPDIPESNGAAKSDQEDVIKSSKKPPEEGEVPCDLHFIVGCQSCKAWDNQEEGESDDDTGWMSHALTFAKDRLGKDLEWKRKNEEELVVIDPLLKAEELKGQKTAKYNLMGKGRSAKA